jgi:N-succinyldiaminopimelate aminotransferase
MTHGTTTRLAPFGTTIFTTISHRAAAVNAINLGQGFPDEDPPEALIEATIASLQAGHNQYAPMSGIPELRQAIANDQARRGRQRWNPDDEVTVTSGATGALAAALLGTLEHDDEVILFDPAYDAYPALVAMAGAHARRLAPPAPEFRITRELIEKAITPRTRMIVLNSPWNPTGRVLDDQELADVADCCIKHDLICVSDEVYERLVFTRPHRSIGSMPGMRDRTIVISSMGKTYSCTGWKVGWACATGSLTAAIRAAHQFLVFSLPVPLQKAATRALNDYGNDWDRSLISSYGTRRELLLEGLASAGLKPIAPEGTYFILADITGLGDDDDHAFCDRMLETVGIAAIPSSVFTDGGAGMKSMVRFAFCKPQALIQEALDRLARLTPRIRGDVR